MKWETIVGSILIAVLLGSLLLYKVAPKKTSESQVVSSNTFLSLEEKKARLPLAPAISSPDGFINTQGKAIALSEYIGKKVVLLDIWTYSCINCQRTIPYLNAWYEKYKDQGLVIVGLHTPEFSFERVQSNVEKAVRNLGIAYPVVLDNDFSTWRAYNNEYWPRKYLIDIDGYIVYDHAGEGNYEETERAIQHVLEERKERLKSAESITHSIADPKNAVSTEGGKIQSPEIYFGSARNEYLANGEAGKPGTQNFTLPNSKAQNSLYLGGTWTIASEYALTSEGEIVFPYSAKNVYMVAGSEKGASIDVYVDDVLTKTLFVQAETLYTVVEGKEYGPHVLKLHIYGPGIKAFTFTFG